MKKIILTTLLTLSVILSVQAGVGDLTNPEDGVGPTGYYAIYSHTNQSTGLVIWNFIGITTLSNCRSELNQALSSPGRNLIKRCSMILTAP